MNKFVFLLLDKSYHISFHSIMKLIDTMKQTCLICTNTLLLYHE